MNQLEIVQASRITAEQEKEYKDAFSLFDKDNDGKIESKGLGIVMRSIGLNPTEAELQDMISEVSGGVQQHITFEQFKNIVSRKISSTDAENEIREALRIFDKNGAGFINSSELRYILTTLGERLSEEEGDEIIRTLDPGSTGEVLLYLYLGTHRYCNKNLGW